MSSQITASALVVSSAALVIGLASLAARRDRKNEEENLRRRAEASSRSSSVELHETPDLGKQLPFPREKAIRIWMDGAYDIMHYGHTNAFRQGRALGTHLVVGINSSESITRCKGCAPLMSDEERIAAVEACRFVDEIVRDVPYVMTEEYIAFIIEKYDIDLIVHGDDPCIVDGRDVYATAKARGMYREIARTEGVSTTDIIGRLLSSTDSPGPEHEFPTRRSPFTTSSMYQAFSVGQPKEPPPGARIVYVDGSWDLFHAGHVSVLRQALSFGDYVIVGVHDDTEVNRVWGPRFPIMSLQERALSVLGCRFVDDVLIGPPVEVSRQMLSALNIHVVLRFPEDAADGQKAPTLLAEDRYAIPREMGILRDYRSGFDLSIRHIAQRVRAETETLRLKFARKSAAETEHSEKKAHAAGY